MKIEKEDLFKFSELLLFFSGVLLALAYGLFVIRLIQTEALNFLLIRSYDFKNLDAFKYFIEITNILSVPLAVFGALLPSTLFILRTYERYKKLESDDKIPAKNVIDSSISANFIMFVVEILTAFVFFTIAYIYTQQGIGYIDMLIKKFL